MGRKCAIDIADGLAFVMKEDRAYKKREIAIHFSCGDDAVANWARRVRGDGHPLRITPNGYWYMNGRGWTLEKIAVLANAQAWAAMQETRMKQIASECDRDLRHVPKHLLLEYKQQ